MEGILDLSPPGIDEIIALTQITELADQGGYHTVVVDSAPTGHLIRLMEMPELLDHWLKAFLGLFLKYKQIFRLPQVIQRLVKISKNLKRLRLNFGGSLPVCHVRSLHFDGNGIGGNRKIS